MVYEETFIKIKERLDANVVGEILVNRTYMYTVEPALTNMFHTWDLDKLD